MQQHTESLNQSKSDSKELHAVVNETIINTYERPYVVLDDKLKRLIKALF